MGNPAGDGRETSFRVEVVYALPDRQILLALDVPQGTTVRQAIHASGVLQRHPEIDLAFNRVGVFGQLISLDEVLRARDRVEIYRPLISDPKETRRRRARE